MVHTLQIAAQTAGRTASASFSTYRLKRKQPSQDYAEMATGTHLLSVTGSRVLLSYRLSEVYGTAVEWTPLITTPYRSPACCICRREADVLNNLRFLELC